MSYYTITILLQSAYLPIHQDTSSRNSTPSAKPADSNEETATMSLTVSDSQSQAQIEEDKEDKEKRPTDQEYFNTAHQICSELSNVLLHHVELMLDFYPQWCTIQAKINHVLTAALRVSCLNAKLTNSSALIRQEAKAEFKMGSELFKRLTLLPYPLTIRDRPAEDDVESLLEFEAEFKEMMITQEKQEDGVTTTTRTSTPVPLTETEADQIMGNEGEGAATSPATTREGVMYSKGKQDGGFVSRQHIFGLEVDEKYTFNFVNRKGRT